MATRFANPAPQYFYNGTPAAPLSGGLMYFYTPGSLSLKNTYSDDDLSVANANPVVLSSSGVLPSVFLNGEYRVILKDKDGVQQWDKDNVNSIATTAFSAWDNAVNYGVGGTNVVYASDTLYYVSIATPNTANNPSGGASPTYWQPLPEFMDVYATTAQTNAGTSSTVAVTPAGVTITKRGLIDGLTMTNAADADHDITVAAGVATDSTNVITLVRSSALTKQIDATWASGNNAGGLAATLTVANTTWYHVFVVTVAGSVDVMFDTSITCATGVANNAVTSFRRIGSVLTNGSANIIAFKQQGDYFYWDVPVQNASTNNPGTSAVSVTTTTPLGVSCLAMLSFATFFTGGSIGAAVLAILITDSTQTDTVPTATVNTLRVFMNGLDSFWQTTSIDHFTNTSSQIRYRLSASDAGVSVEISTQGWMDLRGKA